mmetsp:Transcript_2441/g.2584  ORF Transcript_2441/g.2584 Transcript_2441/m.2584 type:complete len:145 (+) Transcript_2441:1-435(+)
MVMMKTSVCYKFLYRLVFLPAPQMEPQHSSGAKDSAGSICHRFRCRESSSHRMVRPLKSPFIMFAPIFVSVDRFAVWFVVWALSVFLSGSSSAIPASGLTGCCITLGALAAAVMKPTSSCGAGGKCGAPVMNAFLASSLKRRKP